MAGKWSKERIWDWYNSTPWLRGCNFMSSDCANRIDQWQELGFEERLATTDRELALAAETGFNTIRIIPEFIVWKEEHDGFMDRFERYLQVCAKHGISCMVVFGNDCMPPKNEAWKPLTLGPQHYDWGYHGGRKNSQHGVFVGPGYHLLDEPEIAQEHYKWVEEIVTKYKNDSRIIIWDLFNEPGNSNRKSMSLPNLKKFFEIVRDIDPIQPCTVGVFHSTQLGNLPEIEQFGLDNSDITSYHSYSSYRTNVEIIHDLKELGRPIINTEWLGRVTGSNVAEQFPLFYLEKVGCYNWGFVAGKYQTYEPWEGTWTQYYNDPEHSNFDFTKWFHDLYRPNLRPYDPREIELIQHFCQRADRDFEKLHK